MNPCSTVWQRKWLKLSVVDPLIQQLADSAESYCARWMRNEPSKTLLVICGKTGCGKTHTAKAIYKFCCATARRAFDTQKWGASKWPSSTFIKWPEACNEFNAKNNALVEDASNNELCVLDDVGAENDPWKICGDKLCQILSRREKKFTVITTNIAPAAWSSVFDVRITDRLLRNSVVVDLSELKSFSA